MKKTFSLFFLKTIIFFLFVSFQYLFSQNIIGGSLYNKNTSSLTIETTVNLYVIDSITGDHNTIHIKWGDNTSDSVPRIDKICFPDHICCNRYCSVHTYPGPGNYQLIAECNHWLDSIKNIPDSKNVMFSLTAYIHLSPETGSNNSPEFLYPPLDKASVGSLFIHNSGAIDTDGDSLAYKLVKCTGLNGGEISGYTFPPASQSFSMNEVTGDLIWDAPVGKGLYATAMQIEEWRLGIRIGIYLRQMTISVESPSLMKDIYREKTELTVFPNPSHDIINVTAGDGVIEYYIIYNSIGQPVKSEWIDNLFLSLGIKNFSNGLYTIILKTNKGFFQTRFVKE